MNRHKNMRNIQQNAMDELYQEEEYYDDEAVDPAPTDMDDDTANQLIDSVFEVIGDEEFDEDTVWRALERNRYDPEAAVDYLLNPPAKKEKPKKEKKSEKSMIELIRQK